MVDKGIEQAIAEVCSRPEIPPPYLIVIVEVGTGRLSYSRFEWNEGRPVWKDLVVYHSSNEPYYGQRTVLVISQATGSTGVINFMSGGEPEFHLIH